MSNNNRGEFSSSLGFILAAAGAAIGLGNIWGFPSQAAQNGGAAFVLVYLALSFLIAYPALMAELIIGRYAQSNAVGAFQKIPGGKKFVWVGYAGLISTSLILSFYAIVAGWMMAFGVEPLLRVMGLNEAANWVISQSISSNILFTILFYLISIGVVVGGVSRGIERWSSRLMPALLVMLVILIVYVLTLDGAMKGLKVYLVPDFSKLTDPNLIINALGQSFFSLSVGVGAMLVYGSYVSKKENISRLGILVTLADLGIAFLAGFLIIPAMYAAEAHGAEIFDANGHLLADGDIVFKVLPTLFQTMGVWGVPVAVIFFVLMTIAALTSAMSMLENSVSYAVDSGKMPRKKATWAIGLGILLISLLIIFNFDLLFNFVVTLVTVYSLPILAIFFCIFIGWVMNRNEVLNEIRKGHPEVEKSFFFKFWPIFVKIVTPLLIL
ncbi:sodium-dependent transporter, partial [Xanthovirga aplysinae]|uniref:sodium-dependent transporter n=1 Tax=Xanthovirga aplysinae TaxID=2529853 RepID=UPI0012BCD66A